MRSETVDMLLDQIRELKAENAKLDVALQCELNTRGDLKAENARLKETLSIISGAVVCFGPGCLYCDGDYEHPLASNAKLARQALEETT